MADLMSLRSVAGGILLCLFIPDAVFAEICMRAVRSGGVTSHANNNDVNDTGDNYTTKDGDNRSRGTPLHSWRWENFDCAGAGCCGATGSQSCCAEKSSLAENPGLLAAISTGIVFLVITIIIVLVTCARCRSRQKPSPASVRPRHRAASSIPSTRNLPPSYETTLTMPSDGTGCAFPMPEMPYAPPSYEEVMGSSDATESISPCDSVTTHVQAHAQRQMCMLHGRDNLAFSLTEEANTAATNGISR